MKSLSWILLVGVLCAVGCKDDPAPATSAFTSHPDALAAENLKSGGIYKGVLVGSSGFLVVVLQSGKKEIRVTVDGESRTLATDGLTSWVSGTLIKPTVFTSGDWSVSFSVGPEGQSPSISLNIAGHAGAEAVILKELSTDQVRIYEGSYSGSETGTWNFVVQGPVLSGVSRNTSDSSTTTFYGLVSEGKITLEPPITGSGTFSVDDVSGTWQTDTSVSGTWTGKRVM